MDVNAILNASNSIYEENKKTTEVKNEEVVTKASETTTKKTDDNENAAIYEKASNKDSVVDEKTIQAMLEESNQRTESLRKLIASLLSKQGSKQVIANKESNDSVSALGFEFPTENIKAFMSNLEVDEETRLKAQEEISEDGYYGVKQTSERILGFAKAIAGNDPAKIAEMREAVEKGFEQAEKMWGDELPEICQQTYDNVMAEFDSWATVASGATEAVAE